MKRLSVFLFIPFTIGCHDNTTTHAAAPGCDCGSDTLKSGYYVYVYKEPFIQVGPSIEYCKPKVEYTLGAFSKIVRGYSE